MCRKDLRKYTSPVRREHRSATNAQRGGMKVGSDMVARNGGGRSRRLVEWNHVGPARWLCGCSARRIEAQDRIGPASPTCGTEQVQCSDAAAFSSRGNVCTAAFPKYQTVHTPSSPLRGTTLSITESYFVLSVARLGTTKEESNSLV